MVSRAGSILVFSSRRSSERSSFVQTAVAHYRATDSTALLDVATAFADHVDDVFGPNGHDGVPGHNEIELALLKLYRVTGEERYLDLAAHFAGSRGQDPSPLAEELANVEGIAGDEFVYNGQRSVDIVRNHFLVNERVRRQLRPEPPPDTRTE